mgnify:CR=1 FL=1
MEKKDVIKGVIIGAAFLYGLCYLYSYLSESKDDEYKRDAEVR